MRRLVVESSQISIAGSCEIACTSGSKPSRANFRSSSFWSSMSCGSVTFAALVAKWLCHKSVIFSGSGAGVLRIR